MSYRNSNTGRISMASMASMSRAQPVSLGFGVFAIRFASPGKG